MTPILCGTSLLSLPIISLHFQYFVSCSNMIYPTDMLQPSMYTWHACDSYSLWYVIFWPITSLQQTFNTIFLQWHGLLNQLSVCLTVWWRKMQCTPVLQILSLEVHTSHADILKQASLAIHTNYALEKRWYKNPPELGSKHHVAQLQLQEGANSHQ